MKSGRIAGIILLASGVAVGVVGVAVLGLFSAAAGLAPAGFGVGVVLVAIVSLPLLAAGVFLLARASQESRDDELVAKQRRILDMVSARGEVRISDMAIELKVSRDQIQAWVYNLVGLGLFTGYINWDDGVLYSAQASQLRNITECKKCGGKVSLAGKGVVRCQYCGTDYFL